MKTKEKHLYYITELGDYKISSKDPDIREWEVKDRDYMSIGRVDNLIVNKELGKVVYLDVNVNQSIIDKNHDPYSPNSNTGFKEFINKEGENHIIIPIGLVDLNTKEKFCYTDSLDHRIFAETKRYRTGDPISRDYEKNVLSSYNRNNRPHEIEGKKAALSEDEYVSREYSARKDGNATKVYSETTEERIAREKANMQYKSDTLHDRERTERRFDDRSESVEERMERERAQLRATSGDRPVEVHATRRSDVVTTNDGFRPERTYDDDTNWKKDDHYLSDEEIEARERRRRREEDEFYDRTEFRRRDRY